MYVMKWDLDTLDALSVAHSMSYNFHLRIAIYAPVFFLILMEPYLL